MSSRLVTWLAHSRVALLVTSGSVVAASATAGVLLTGRVVGHTAVKGEKFTNSTPAGNANNGNGNGNGNAGAPPGKAFTMTVRAVGTIGPGQRQTLNVTVNNPNNQNMAITGATGVVNSVNKQGCLASWFSVENWTPGATPTIAPANGTAVIQMKLDFVDTSANQDVCKSTAGSPVTIGFTLHATGAQA